MQDTYFQKYIENDKELICFWGISNGRLSFFVIDLENGLNENHCKIVAGENGNKGILVVNNEERCLDNTGAIVEITGNGVQEKEYTISEEQFNNYLEKGNYSLSLMGFMAYVNELRA